VNNLLRRDGTDHTLLAVEVEGNAQEVVFRLLEDLVGQEFDDDAVVLVGDAGDEFN
jgi:hypothetical protein